MIRPEHLRMARAALNWTLGELAQRSSVNPNTLSRFELGRDILSGTLRKAEETLLAAGITFIDDGEVIGVHLRQGEDHLRSSQPRRKPVSSSSASRKSR
jgi:transcriptional regulator with XRE-family HTH domain